jgi:hypothetical protein
MEKKISLGLPRSVREAAERLAGDLNDSEKAAISRMDNQEINYLHSSLGRKARDSFGMWSGNEQLMEDCARVMGKAGSQVDQQDASTKILLELRQVCRGF